MVPVAGRMAITISIQNKGGKEVVKGGLEVSSGVVVKIARYDADLFGLYLHN